MIMLKQFRGSGWGEIKNWQRYDRANKCSLCVKKRNSRRPMSFWGNPSLLHRPGMLSCLQLQPVFTNCSSPDTFLHLLPWHEIWVVGLRWKGKVWHFISVSCFHQVSKEKLTWDESVFLEKKIPHHFRQAFWYGKGVRYSMIVWNWNKVNSYISALKHLPRHPNRSKRP